MTTPHDAPPSDDDATRQDDLASLDDFPQLVRREELVCMRQAIPLPEHPTLCIRMRDGGKLETEFDPRLKRLDWRDRQKFLYWALSALAITPREYLDHAGYFFALHADDELHADDDPSMLAHWLKIARIVRAAYHEVENPNSDFLKKADAAARAVLEKHDERFMFSARSVAFEHLRDDVEILLKQGLTTEHITAHLWAEMFGANYHEIAQHIPDLGRAPISKQKMLDKLDVARDKPHKPGDFKEQAESMIRAWLRAMGCPDKIVIGAFNAERLREERVLERRK
jgi:hypothetical protein